MILPSIGSIQAFEATARLKSMRKASDELHVTPSAITHRINTLETWLGTPLLRRVHREIVLTNVGEQYFTVIQKVLHDLASASQGIINRAEGSDNLRISTTSTFATLWLAPRLHAFREIAPYINLRITTEDRFVNLDQGEFDIAIRYGQNNWSHVKSSLLFHDEVFPVCSKEYLASLTSNKAESPKCHTLLHHEMGVSWSDWVSSATHSELCDTALELNRGLYFDRSYLAIQAAIAGEGIVLASRPMVSEAIEQERLIKPFSMAIVPDSSYYLLASCTSSENAATRIFSEWISAQQSH